jgi:hypothetical protein
MNRIYIDEDLKRANRTEIESRNDQNQNWTMIICSREKVDQDENLEQKIGTKWELILSRIRQINHL